MKRNTIIILILFIVGSYLSGFFGPWWAPAGFLMLVAALLKLPARQAMITGGISLGVVYLAEAIRMHWMDDSEIITKTGLLLGGLSPILMIVMTTLIGSLTGLLSGWIGSIIGNLTGKKEKE
jgi:hypothetical protein